MSASSQSSSSSPDNTQAGGVVDPLDLLDFTEYDNMAYQSPSVSPIASNKAQFARNSVVSATPTTMPSSQSMPGPSHQYDQYKQQTPFVPGALASTMAVNQSSSMGYNLDFMANLSPSDDLFDFNATQTPNMDLDFDSPDAFFFPEATITPSATQQTLPSPPAVTSNVGRMYPGMHQQAALAKAQAQQRQQQQIIQQQQQRQQSQPPKQQRSKATPPTDPIVEQKISQLLNSMRSKPAPPESANDNSHSSIVRPKKEDDDMDDDERLLASEEGKKLSSKERRQLRNKVSARAFRSRRKEYITQLEAEIATKVTENGDLRAQNRALLDENRRLSDLTRMLLSSPSFSNFLDHLSANPAAVPQQPAPVQQVQQVEQRESEARQMPKDVNPYAGPNQIQQQQIGMAMIPEHTMDFSMLNLDSDAFNFQPQVFTVLETPEMPEIDTAILAGKSSSHEVDSFESDNSKVEIPVLEAPALLESAKAQAPESPVASESSEKAVASLDDDIFDDAVESRAASPAKSETTIDSSVDVDLFGGVEPEKALARYELVDASEEEAASARALMRVQRISASLDATMARLERLTAGL